MHFSSTVIFVVLSALGLAGCNPFGGESAEAAAARREADGKAVGGACRHAGRAIEDCYSLNRRADKAAVYAGWREMNDYMRENKLEPVAPQLNSDTAVARSGDAATEGKKSGKAADKVAAEKAPDKSKPKARDADGEAAKKHDS